MADSAHYHDAHEGNVLLFVSGADLPEIRWHDSWGSYNPVSASFTPAFATDFARKIESFSDTVIKRIKTTDQDLSARLHETRKKCTLVGQAIESVPLCLRQRAFSFAETLLNADAMDSGARRRLWKGFRGDWTISPNRSCGDSSLKARLFSAETNSIRAHMRKPRLTFAKLYLRYFNAFVILFTCLSYGLIPL